MLSWLKRRAKVTVNNRYINIFRSNINTTTNMFVSEPVALINDHNLKLTVFNTDGRDYHLESIPSVTSVEQVRKMAVGHFYGHYEPDTGRLTDERAGGGLPDLKGSSNRSFRLVVLRGARPLLDVNPLHFEKLIDNDVLLLVERRLPPSQPQESAIDVPFPTVKEIANATCHIPKRNDNRDPDPTHTSADFQTEFRRILVTMIEASVRLISADPDSKEVFTQILDKLERRHRPRVDRVALRQLTEMGFVETKATKALQVKRNFNEAVEWLLDEQNMEESDVKTEDETAVTESDSVLEKNSLRDKQEDPAKRILRQFLQYRRKWFQPNQQALQKLSQLGYPEDRIIDALRANGNNENHARETLVDNKEIAPDDEGLERDSPIISAILASPVIQLALPKPKTLLALMMLYESPNNANMWLSDPDTHPVVSQVLRIYHAEKHSLNHNRTPPTSSCTPQTSEVNALPSENHRSFARSATPPRSNSSIGSVYPARSSIQLHVPFNSDYHQERTASNGSIGSDPPNIPWASFNSSLLSMPRVSPNSSPVPSSRLDSLPSAALAPNHQEQTVAEEPMSHSGSPVRSMTGFRALPNIANGDTQEISTPFCSSATPQNTTTTDVEMDETGHDSHDMDIQ